MKLRWVHSLSLSLIIWYLFLFLTLVFLLSWSVVKIVETEVLKEQIKNFELFSEITKSYAEKTIISSRKTPDIETLTRWLSDPLRKKGILLGMEILYSWEPVVKTGNISGTGDEIAAFLSSKKEKKVFLNLKKRILTVSEYHWVDIFMRSRRNIQIIMRFDLSWFNGVAKRIFRLLFLYIFATSIVIIVVLLWITERKVISPIGKLIESSEKIARGDFLKKKPFHSSDELGFLAESMFSMSKKIEEDRNTIINQVRELNEAYRKLKEMQEEIIKNEKLALIGQMTSGLAHEIGNPITSIIGLTQILLQSPDISDEEKDILRRILSEGKRIDNLIRTLLDFSRPRREEYRKVRLKNLINRALDLLNIQGKLKRISVEVRGEDYEICAEEEKLLQVILNLLVNASDAIREKFGKNEGGYIRVELKKSEEIITVQIEDNGIGIEEKNLKKIFLPFFTTKEPGKGTGLGLYVSSMIIEQMGGKIEVESSPEIGTRFQIKLPEGKEMC